MEGVPGKLRQERGGHCKHWLSDLDLDQLNNTFIVAGVPFLISLVWTILVYCQSQMYPNDGHFNAQVQGDQLHGRVFLVPYKTLPDVRHCTIAYTSVTFYKVPEQHGHVDLTGL